MYVHILYMYIHTCTCTFTLYMYSHLQPWRTKDQDLRSLIRRRKGEVTHTDSEDEDNERGGVSSVVKLPEKQER